MSIVKTLIITMNYTQWYNINTQKVAFCAYWFWIPTSSFKLLAIEGSSESELKFSPETFLDTGFITLIEWELLNGLVRLTLRQCRIHGLNSGFELIVVSTRVQPCPFSSSTGLETSKLSQMKILWNRITNRYRQHIYLPGPIFGSCIASFVPFA